MFTYIKYTCHVTGYLSFWTLAAECDLAQARSLLLLDPAISQHQHNDTMNADVQERIPRQVQLYKST